MFMDFSVKIRKKSISLEIYITDQESPKNSNKIFIFLYVIIEIGKISHQSKGIQKFNLLHVRSQVRSVVRSTQKSFVSLASNIYKNKIVKPTETENFGCKRCFQLLRKLSFFLARNIQKLQMGKLFYRNIQRVAYLVALLRWVDFVKILSSFCCCWFAEFGCNPNDLFLYLWFRCTVFFYVVNTSLHSGLYAVYSTFSRFCEVFLLSFLTS